MSWRAELISNRMSPDTYNFRLNAVNIVVSLITVLMPAIDWVLYSYSLNRAETFVNYADNLSLLLSFFILIWGFNRLTRIIQSTNDHIVKQSVIIWHIAAYFFVIIANILVVFFYATPKQYEITTICSLTINLAATIILAFIVNAICTKFFERRTATDASVLISYYMPGTSIQSDTSRT
jgi:hypothetical protein